MKTTEQYFQEFYNEIRYQIKQGSQANFTRANKIWAEYEAAQQSKQADKETIHKQAQNGMDNLIDPLLDSTKELLRIIKSRQQSEQAEGGCTCERDIVGNFVHPDLDCLVHFPRRK